MPWANGVPSRLHRGQHAAISNTRKRHLENHLASNGHARVVPTGGAPGYRKRDFDDFSFTLSPNHRGAGASQSVTDNPRVYAADTAKHKRQS